MAIPPPLRRVRRAKPDKTYTRAELAVLLNRSVRAVDRWRQLGKLKPHPTPGAVVRFAQPAVQSWLEVHFYKLREARPGEFEASEVARG